MNGLKTAHRVVSLLPSATEIVTGVGAQHLLVGRSHECDFPAGLEDLPILTSAVHSYESMGQIDAVVSASVAAGESLYNLDAEKLQELQPTVVVTQSVCAVCAVDFRLVQSVAAKLVPQPIVIDLDPRTVWDVIGDLQRVGEALGMQQEAEAAGKKLRQRVERASRLAAEKSALLGGYRPKVAVLEWVDPIYPGGHWTPHLLKLACATHPLNPSRGDRGADPSKAVPNSAIAEADPDWLIVAPCGLDLATTRRELAAICRQAWWQELRAVRDDRVVLVDGSQMFNRPGPRLVDALEWLVALLHGVEELEPAGFPWEHWVPPPATNGAQDGTTTANGGAAGGGGGPAAAAEEDDEVIDERTMAGLPAAPGLAPDIEEAHKQAMGEGANTYKDPGTGYTVITEAALRRRGWCCGSRCRHCPFGHYKVDAAKLQRKNRIWVPTLLRPTTAALSGPYSLMPYEGGDVDTSPDAQQHDKQVVWLVAFEVKSLRVWGRSDLSLGQVMDASKRLKRLTVAVPLCRDAQPRCLEDLAGAVIAAQELLQGKAEEVLVSWDVESEAAATVPLPLKRMST